jgi:hypothetical protein
MQNNVEFVPFLVFISEFLHFLLPRLKRKRTRIVAEVDDLKI